MKLTQQLHFIYQY